MQKLVLAIIPILLLLQNTLSAQASSILAANPVFVMSSVGSMGNTRNQSPAFQFKSTANCIDVQNGIAVLSGERGNGLFSIKCEVDQSFNSLGIKLYPNPAINNTKLQVNNPPPNNEVFSICIWTTNGQLISSRKESGNDLMRGINIDLIGLSYGTYILRIESAKSVDVIKFIKER